MRKYIRGKQWNRFMWRKQYNKRCNLSRSTSGTHSEQWLRTNRSHRSSCGARI
jgi:hypothetical protein